MRTATQNFIDGLESWIRAIQDGNYVEARAFAENVILRGELLAVHPDFMRCFQRHCPDVDPRAFLNTLSQFLMCTTDNRKRAS